MSYRSRPFLYAAAWAASLALASTSLAQSTGYGPSANQGDKSEPSPSAPGSSDKPQSTGSNDHPYSKFRWEEDYSYLRTAPKTDFFDPIKYVPLGVDDWYATFGGEVRDRYENYNHNNWGSGAQDPNGYNLARMYLDADLHFGPHFRVFAEGEGVWEDGRNGGPRGRDRDEVDLSQGFADLMLPFGDNKHDGLTVRAGRQLMAFGAERLIGPADWSNQRKNHDGVRVTLVTGDNQLDGFVTRPVEVDRYEFDDAINTTVFAGLYDSLKLPQFMPGSKTKVEAYVLYVERKGQTIGNDGSGREKRYTLGGRMTAAPKPFDYDVEADYQGGSFAGEDIQAYSLASEVGYHFDHVAFQPRAFLGFDIASGDRSAGGRMQTFDQIYPSGHTYFGYMDFIGRQNIIDLHPGFDFKIAEHHKYVENMTLRAEYHQFWRQSTTDSIYDTSGAVIRANSTNTSARNIGSEIDLLLRWQIDHHLSSYFGYSHFFHGSYIQDTGPHKDVDFTYAAVQYTF